MDKTAIKNFAVWARVKLMEDIRTRLGLLGITEDGISDPLPASTNEVKYFDIGADHPVSIKGKAIRQREQLAEKIRKAGKESNYQSAYRNFVESSAYDWFNRLIAIRYMEVNEYAPLDVRLLSSVEPGKQDPDLVSTPFDGSLEYSESETQQILAWKEQHDNNKLFRFLLFKMCNQLHEVLPGIFEVRDDASELLMRQSFIDKDGIIHHLVNDIPEEDWKDQVQIIGWIYQYYNSELKAEVFAKKEKVTKDELPAVTQLFTPDWIVRYMVENSLGRLWIEHLRGLNPDVDEKETAEKFGWKYYLPEAKQEPEVEQQLAKIREEYAALKPEDLSCLDPCMGSGHILVYMFDVLEQIYTSVGYSEREAAKAILENNIYGLDIDDRAYQLAYFAVMMKARQYNRRILTSGIQAHVYSIQESNGINRAHLKYFGAGMDDTEKNAAKMQLEGLLDTLTDAKEYGSILNVESYNWDLLRRFVAAEETVDQISMDNMGAEDTAEQLNRLIDIGETMARKYWVTCTNPPYAGMSKMNAKLNSFVQNNYADYKSDMFSAFVVKCSTMTQTNGCCAFLTPYVWMFIQSYEKMRKYLYANAMIETLIQFEYSAFEEATVPICTFAFRKGYIAKRGCYLRLTDFRGGMEVQRQKTLEAINNHNCGYYFEQCSDNFAKIPGSPVAYWVSESVFDAFTKEHLADHYIIRNGISTGNNEKYLRTWAEVSALKEYWKPCNKGGPFRKWYGNNEYYVYWKDDGASIRTALDDKGRVKARLGGIEFSFNRGIEMSRITSGELGFRISEGGFVYESSTNDIYEACNAWTLDWLLAYCNTKVVSYFLNLMNPTINIMPEDLRKLPCPRLDTERVVEIEKSNIEISKEDWDSFENSWDFKKHPLLRNVSTISEAFTKWQTECEDRFNQLKANEEELNRIFIDIYGLQNELTPEVEDKDVTVHRVFENRDEMPDSMKNSNYTRTYRDEIVSLLSYAVGCMFGRYSLDKEGLIYAGGDWKSVQDVYKTFLPDKDNVIPITDQKYLDDDVVERICEFLTVVYGAETLEENLDFIAKALGNKGLTSREVIRNYMLHDFFKDHCKTYSVTGSGKRPIYWLFDSGKENAFKALVYMHRWDADTTGRVLLYTQQIQQKYETEIRAIDMMLDHISDARQKSTEEKRQEHLKKQLEELVDYEERLEHMANERIAIDLDDGVKVNYEKVQTDRNGKKYQILAPIK